MVLGWKSISNLVLTGFKEFELSSWDGSTTYLESDINDLSISYRSDMYSSVTHTQSLPQTQILFIKLRLFDVAEFAVWNIWSTTNLVAKI